MTTKHALITGDDLRFGARCNQLLVRRHLTSEDYRNVLRRLRYLNIRLSSETHVGKDKPQPH
jgi:hypothetical protein